MTGAHSHQPVLLQAAVTAMHIHPQGCYIDGTFGRGGHSEAILQQLDERGSLYALDKDFSAVQYGRKKFAGDARFHMLHSSFARLSGVAAQYELLGRVDGLLLDLGVSSPQLDEAQRGFSFQQDGPLDMRMDQDRHPSAAEWLASAKDDEIANVLWEYGEERFSRRIARAVVETRQQTPLQTTSQLAELIDRAIPFRERHKHPATRSFQAIRIFINQELEDLQQCLQQSLDVLAKGGRLVVISFHSLEDRIVKRFMRDQARGEVLPKGLPVPDSARKPGRIKLLGKAVKPTKDEIRANPRARSAIMRVAEVVA